MKSPILPCAMVLTFSLGALNAVCAGSATWNLNPTSGDWNTAANWTPPTVPSDIATFDLSNQTAITVSTFGTEVNELIFNPGASAFTMTNDGDFIISGTGIINNSGIAQNFVVTNSLINLVLTNSATAGDMTFFTVTNGYPFGGFMIFENTSTAANGTFAIEGNDSALGNGGALVFADSSSAGSGSFTVNGGSVPGGTSGNIDFEGGTAGNGVFVINAGTESGALGGSVLFSGGTAGNATLIANPGTNGGFGGQIRYAFTGTPDQSEARIELFGNGTLDMTYGVHGGRTVGSIEGDGLILLGGNQLITGANHLSTIFSGTIGPGSVTKIGAGTLTLTGANTYDSSTTINGGALVVDNMTGSATGSGSVHVNVGRLGGGGSIAGTVIVGSGNGPGAALVPRKRGGRPDTLIISSQLTFNSDGRYTCELNTKSGIAGTVVANGVTIESGAQFDFVSVANKRLMPGTVVVLISNTSANPISGEFANLPDGSTFTVGSNTFQVSYEGGDGNDLTLTVAE